jgi:serine/threonine-protein kinase
MLLDLQRTLSEPNTRIAGSGIVEELPTKKMQAIGADVDNLYEDEAGNEEEIENGKGKKTNNRKKDRLSIWLGIATGLIIASILFYIGMKVFIPAIMPDNSDEYVVLDYTNKNFNDVREELSKYDITADDSDREYSDTIGQDIIISQDVAVGNKLKPGNTIHFKVSDGPKLVEIPDISGKEARVGEQIIRDKELEPIEETENSDTVGTGLVIRTEPAALEKVRPNESVTVYVSLGPKLEKVKVPNLIGRTRKEAEKLITDNKLKIGAIIPSDVISDVAKIIKQYPAADTEVDEETPVEMTFEINDGTQNPTDQTTPDNTSNEPKGSTNDSEPRTKLLTITLNPNNNYGDEIMVYVETTPSDTNQLNVVFNQKKAKKDFPFSIPVELAKSGTTHIIVKLDDVLIQEGDY